MHRLDGPDHGRRHRDVRRHQQVRGARYGWASCPAWDGFHRHLQDADHQRPEHHPCGEHRDVHRLRRRHLYGEHPDGDRLHLRRAAGLRGRDGHLQCGCHRDEACLVRLRTGCCPDAGDVRCRRRGPGASPETWQTGCCRDGDRPDEGLNHPGVREPPALPELQPWEPDAHRAWRPWTVQRVQPEQQRLLEPPELTTSEPELQERPQQERVLLPWQLVPEQQVPVPWARQDQAQAPDV